MNAYTLVMNDLRALLHDQFVGMTVWAFSTLAYLGILGIRLPERLLEQPAAMFMYIFFSSSLGYILVCVPLFITKAIDMETSNYFSIFFILIGIAFARILISVKAHLKKGYAAYGQEKP